MDYLAPTDLADVYAALAAGESRCLAGGQSLVAMMNLGLLMPERLVSLAGVAALRGITTLADGSLRIGAMTTHSELAAHAGGPAGARLLAKAAAVVAYPAVRAWGTIGGSVAHADPAADYPAVLVAAQATIETGAQAGSRRIAAADFFSGLFETALHRGEIVTAIHLPPTPLAATTAYEKLSLVAGDFAILSIAAIVAGGTAQIAVGGYCPTPRSVNTADLSEQALLEAGRALGSEREVMNDHRSSADYRRKVLPAILLRTVRKAQASHE